MGTSQTRPEWIDNTTPPFFKARDVVSLKDDWLQARQEPGSVPSLWVVDSFSPLRSVYILLRLDDEKGEVEQGAGLAVHPNAITPIVFTTLPAQEGLPVFPAQHSTYAVESIPDIDKMYPTFEARRDNLLPRVDYRLMESLDAGVCSTETSLDFETAWRFVPSNMYYRSGGDCYDIRQLLAHFDYQLSSDTYRRATAPSLPLNRQPVTPAMLEYILVRAHMNGVTIPPNVLKAMEVYRDQPGAFQADTVSIYDTQRYYENRLFVRLDWARAAEENARAAAVVREPINGPHTTAAVLYRRAYEAHRPDPR